MLTNKSREVNEVIFACQVDIRGQKTEVRGQKTEVRGQRTEDRSQWKVIGCLLLVIRY